MKAIKLTFTLIEMIVILVIIAVMTAIAAPQLANFYQSTELTSSVSRFRTFLDTARLQAALSNGESRIVIQRGWRKICMETKQEPLIKSPAEAVTYLKEGKDRSRGVFKPSEGLFAEIELPNGVSINYISVSGEQKASVQEIVITFKGFSEPDEIRFVFQNARKEYQGLMVEPGSGTVSSMQVIDRDR